MLPSPLRANIATDDTRCKIIYTAFVVEVNMSLARRLPAKNRLWSKYSKKWRREHSRLLTSKGNMRRVSKYKPAQGGCAAAFTRNTVVRALDPTQTRQRHRSWCTEDRFSTTPFSSIKRSATLSQSWYCLGAWKHFGLFWSQVSRSRSFGSWKKRGTRLKMHVSC